MTALQKKGLEEALLILEEQMQLFYKAINDTAQENDIEKIKENFCFYSREGTFANEFTKNIPAAKNWIQAVLQESK